MTDHRYPLKWPQGWPRAKSRTFNASFRSGNRWVTVDRATSDLYFEMAKLLKTKEPKFVLSTNIPLRKDGWPRSDQRPTDPGAAVYFKLRGQDRVLACDKWQEVAQNIRAIQLHIDAVRGMERWGVGTLEQAFTGHAAIPERTDGSDWRAEFGFEPGTAVQVSEVQNRFRELSRQRHPDFGGSHEAMARLNRAREVALEELEVAVG